MKAIAILLIFLSAFTAFSDNPKPNIIFFMADDMGMGDTSAYQDFTANSNEVQVYTPAMEKLASLGMRFTDAHTPSSRCSPTRYGLLTGRYPWRNRLKYWVLFGSQGDPMIERDRPTLATMLKSQGYSTAIVGKWHVGLRYTRSDGKPADGWDDADFSKALYDSPMDHGFDFVRFTSRSHATSGPNPNKKSKLNKSGPGHIHGRKIIGATGHGKEIVKKGPKAYILKDLGKRHSNSAFEFLEKHISESATKNKPFFLYYPSNSNHTPYTPSDEIDGIKVAGASKTKSGKKMDSRHDFIYENDVALNRFINWLQKTDDPRNPGKKLFENTIVVFTSDNGAEKNSNIASGPFRSNKGSVYEGGHRVPFIISWPAKINAGQTNAAPIGLIDMFATFAEISNAPMPDLLKGEKGAEDSFSVLKAFKGDPLKARPPMFFNDNKESKDDPAVAALRLDNPTVDGQVFKGKWKVFFDASLLRMGKAVPFELYDLEKDQWEKNNLLNNAEYKALADHLVEQALLHRNSTGHRLAQYAGKTLSLNLNSKNPIVEISSASSKALSQEGIEDDFVDKGEALLIKFTQDVIVESVSLSAKAGQCGGFYKVGDKASLAIYCIDADIDSKDQSGVLSDIGLVRKGEVLRLDSSPHFGTESPGKWKFLNLKIRTLK